MSQEATGYTRRAADGDSARRRNLTTTGTFAARMLRASVLLLAACRSALATDPAISPVLTLGGCTCQFPFAYGQRNDWITCTPVDAHRYALHNPHAATAVWCKVQQGCGTRDPQGWWFDECPHVALSIPLPPYPSPPAPPSIDACCHGSGCMDARDKACHNNQTDCECINSENRCAKFYHMHGAVPNQVAHPCIWDTSSVASGVCRRARGRDQCPPPSGKGGGGGGPHHGHPPAAAVSPPPPGGKGHGGGGHHHSPPLAVAVAARRGPHHHPRPPRSPHPPHPPRHPGYHLAAAAASAAAAVEHEGVAVAACAGRVAAAHSRHQLDSEQPKRRCAKRRGRRLRRAPGGPRRHRRLLLRGAQAVPMGRAEGADAERSRARGGVAAPREADGRRHAHKGGREHGACRAAGRAAQGRGEWR